MSLLPQRCIPQFSFWERNHGVSQVQEDGTPEKGLHIHRVQAVWGPRPLGEGLHGNDMFYLQETWSPIVELQVQEMRPALVPL
jgi:hypothetical protein